MIAGISSSGVGVSVHGWVATIIIIAAVVTAIMVIIKATTLVMRHVMKVAEVIPVIDKLVQSAPTIAELCDMSDKINVVIREMQPNGGGSLRDQIDKANHGILLMHTALEEHAANDERIQAHLSEQIEAIDALIIVKPVTA